MLLEWQVENVACLNEFYIMPIFLPRDNYSNLI
jgi:hypothetical protein